MFSLLLLIYLNLYFYIFISLWDDTTDIVCTSRIVLICILHVQTFNKKRLNRVLCYVLPVFSAPLLMIFKNILHKNNMYVSTIKIREDTKKRLDLLRGKLGKTYNDIINKLIDIYFSNEYKGMDEVLFNQLIYLSFSFSHFPGLNKESIKDIIEAIGKNNIILNESQYIHLISLFPEYKDVFVKKGKHYYIRDDF